MLTVLNEKLTLIKERLRKQKKWREKLDQSYEDLQKEEEKVDSLLTQLKKEEKDVERLEGISLQHLFQLILGKKEEQLKKEKQEALAAKLKYDEALATVSELKQEIHILEANLQTVASAPEEYKEVLKEKQLMILSKSTAVSEELYTLVERSADLKADLKELDEAIGAGNTVQNSLGKAQHSLEKAKGWGTWDMLGGGMITTAMKHGHIDDARKSVHNAQAHLRHFEKELRDVNQQHNIAIDIGGMLTLADYFFDGLIMDWVVQGRISDSLAQVQQKQKSVAEILDRLEVEKDRVESEWRSVMTRQREIIEGAE